jgi:hypothetical protein
VRYAVSLVGAAAAATVLAACGSSHNAADTGLPKDRLIVLGRSIGPISLRESRAAVRRALGPGTRASRGVVSYFDGRLRVSYWFHDGLTDRVEYIETTWPGFHTRTGAHVGTSRGALRLPRGSCSDQECDLSSGTGPDHPGTVFALRSGKVARIAVGYS